jgi:hypothetical protein
MQAALDGFCPHNSVTMRWCFHNAAHPYADSVSEQLASGEAVMRYCGAMR